MYRRTLMKWMAAGPVYGVIAARSMSEKLAAATGKAPTSEVYRRLGVRPFINARGTWTYLSGSLELPEVRKAVDAAAQHFVDIFELQQHDRKKTCRVIRHGIGYGDIRRSGSDGGSSRRLYCGYGPREGMAVAGHPGLKNEVVMLGSRSAFDSAIRLTGAKLVVVRTLEDLPKALNDKTAMIYTTWLGAPFGESATNGKSCQSTS